VWAVLSMAIALTRKFGMPGVDVVTVGGAAGVAASAVEPKPAAAMAMAMAMLTLLPVRQRTVVTLRDIDGLASEEVCELLGITAANQRVLLHRPALGCGRR